MVRKLLNTNINNRQIIGYAAANLVGMIIVGIALQFYLDISTDTSQSGNDPFADSRYTIVSRKTVTTLFGDLSGGLSEEDLQQTARQPWAAGVAPFIPAGFDVTIGLSVAGHGFSTSLFFEGITAEYLDTNPDGWEFNPDNPEIAIILPRDYLALYNFGFAPARGLPVLDERTVKLAPLKATISGNGLSQSFPAKIVGFSSRLNTIAVPQEFITWANRRFAPEQTPSINRMIIKLSDPGNPDINRYLTANDLEETSSSEASSRMYHILRIIAGAVTAVGLLICLLSLGMLILSIFLLLQKNRSTLAGLINLGYHPRALSGYYIRFVSMVNLAILILAAATTAVISDIWHDKLAALGMQASPVWPTIICMTITISLLTIFSAISIYRNILKICKR